MKIDFMYADFISSLTFGTRSFLASLHFLYPVARAGM